MNELNYIFETDAATVEVKVTDKPQNNPKNADYISDCHQVLLGVEEAGSVTTLLIERIRRILRALGAYKSEATSLKGQVKALQDKAARLIQANANTWHAFNDEENALSLQENADYHTQGDFALRIRTQLTTLARVLTELREARVEIARLQSSNEASEELKKKIASLEAQREYDKGILQIYKSSTGEAHSILDSLNVLKGGKVSDRLRRFVSGLKSTVSF